MIIAAIIIGIILIFLVFLTFYISKRNDGKFDEGVTLGLIIMLLFFTEAFLIYYSDNKPNPTAMDSETQEYWDWFKEQGVINI